MMSLAIHTTPPSVFGREIISVSNLRRALGGQSPTTEITLDNSLGQLTQLFTIPPIRARATLTRDGFKPITGVVQAVSMSSTLVITLET